MFVCTDLRSIPEANPPVAVHRGRAVVCLLTVCLGIGLAAVCIAERTLWSVEALMRGGRMALSRGDLPAALEKAHRAVRRAPGSLGACLLLADVAERADEREEAVDALTRLTEIDFSRASNYWMRIGALEMKRRRVGRADEALRRCLAIDPGRVDALRHRATLMAVVGDSQALKQCLIELIRHRGFEPNDLVVLAAVDPVMYSPDIVDAILQTEPTETLPLLVRARVALRDNRTVEAVQNLKTFVAAEPGHWGAQALLGEIYVQRPGAEFLQWQAGLPAAADANAQVWLVRGIWLREHGHLDEACRCFWEAVQREPELPKATMQVGQTLARCGEVELGRRFLRRGKLLEQIASAAIQIGQMQTWGRASALIDDLEASGRLWEAWAWCSLQARSRPDDEVVTARVGRLAQRLSPDLPRTFRQVVPGNDFDWSRFPLPDWSSYRLEAVPAAPVATRTKIRFVDEAQSVGLDFQFDNDRASPLGRRIFQTTGGGVAALDFDGDGWTDLYFAQGGSWPSVPGQGSRDALFRNTAGRRFDDVTDPSGIVEDRFSQGVAAGDIDNDGFPDLYVANIGRNRLFHNNGDGTFADMTEAAGLKDEAWTTCCAIADLNGDGFADLFDVNYVQGAEAFTMVCADEQGQPRVCQPTIFEPAFDTIALSTGDGAFVELQEQAGLNLPYGRGFGLVVGDFNADRILDVFIANDQGANYLLLNEPGQSGQGGPLRFNEQGHVWGLAFARDGLSKAGMGVASGDINGDGRLDLFLTTFAKETKVLYLSQPDGTYVDRTQEAGLYAPTLGMLDWGTQFFDADLDGQLDLMILNGHVDALATPGSEYSMRAQLFRGLPGPRFVELKDNDANSFFGVKRLGRALATLDWNRDGLLDFVATDLEGPVALGTNKTQPAGNALRLKLVGTASSRDAIGARVRVVPIAGEEVHVQLTAGDGYEASCERLIQVGLGARTQVERLEIEWPSGTKSAFNNVACRETWLAIEGGTQLTPLDRDVP